MRNELGLSSRPTYLPSRRFLAMSIIVSSAGAALFTWHGSVPGVLIPVTVVVLAALVTLVVTRIRRSLRDASSLIDTILREELATPPADQPAPRERVSR